MGSEVDVTVQYMMHVPVGSPKALVVLFAGGRGNTGITGNASTGKVTAAGNNFLVRSAQLFAEQGYLTATIDRLSTGPASNSEFDQYRVSASHAHDIVAVTSAVVDELGVANLHEFLAGTSRGAISVVAQNMLGVGISLSSPVTSVSGDPASLYVSRPDQPRLQPSFVTVPVHILAHRRDGCFVSTPAGAKKLHKDFKKAGVRSRFDKINGGFELSTNLCRARTFHGFLGIETKAVKKITKRLDKILKELNKDFPGNNKPVANAATVSTTAPVNIDLSLLTSDPDGDGLTYSLPHLESSRGAPLSISGSVVAYTPIETGITDGFVYVVS
ncbi:MAG: Ig-like domain-containing protein, partial [Candidatus Binatia bacterium]